MKSLLFIFSMISANRIIASSGDITECAKSAVSLIDPVKTLALDVIKGSSSSTILLDLSLVFSTSVETSNKCQGFSLAEIEGFLLYHLNEAGHICVWETDKIAMLLTNFAKDLLSGKLNPKEFVDFLVEGAQKFEIYYQSCKNMDIIY